VKFSSVIVGYGIVLGWFFGFGDYWRNQVT